jgi:glutaredoxin-like protein NrdH
MSVIVYTKNECPGCTQLKTFLDNNDVQYETRNIEDEDKAVAKKNRDEVIATGFMGVPVIKVGNNDPMIGLQPAKLAEQLGL